MELVPLVFWLLTYTLLAAAGLPLAARLFRPLPTRGAGFALPVALVVLTTVGYWVGHVSFGIVAPAAGLLVLLALSALAGLDRDALRDRRFELADDLDVERSVLVDTAAVFLVAFGFLIAIRLVDPAVHAGGGEKFLDFGLLKSLMRSPVLPPEDMWFAGEPVRYYYGGHLVTALVMKLSGVAPAFGYNLSLAGFYAMLVTAVFDLAGSIYAVRSGVAAGDDGDGGDGDSDDGHSAGRPGGSRRARFVAGSFGAFFVGFASNLSTPARLVLVWAPEPYRTQLARFVADQSPQLDAGEILAGTDSFSYWSASRVIPGTINEFPLFSWLNGDLHAHMMGTVFLLLAAALGYSYFRTPEAERRRRLALVFLAVPVVGSLQVYTDTWSFPSVFGLLFLAVTFAPSDPLSLVSPRLATRLSTRLDGSWVGAEFARTGGALAVTGVAGGLGVLLSLPFLLAAGASREVALLEPAMRSTLGGLALVHGAFLLAFAVYLYRRVDVDDRLLLLVALAVVTAVAVGQNLAVFALVVPLLVFGWLALRMDRDVGYETVLVVAGAGLVVLVEILYVKEQAGPGRMNTVFKTYMQVWVLWATAMGAVLPGLVRGSPLSTPTLRPRAVRSTVGVAVVILLVASTSVYGGLALGQHFGTQSGSTLDATAFADQYHPEEAEAIRWLDREADAETVIISAPAASNYPGATSGSYPYPPGMYTWDSSPAASLTGVPTVAGWAHEVGYRGPEAYYDRVRVVDAAYTGSEADFRTLVDDHGVDYVWVGPAERARYGDSLAVTDMNGLTVAYETEEVTVYRVGGA